MTLQSAWRNSVALLAIGAVLIAPTFAAAQGRGNNKSKNKSWNYAPPKKNGRHDNRDWNKNSSTNRCNDDRFSSERNYNAQWGNDCYGNDYRGGYYGSSKYGNSYYENERRQQTKNEWRNIAYLSGALAVIGLLNKDDTLTFAGSAGALYSLYRYEQDRKSQNQAHRLRAQYFSQPYFYRDGRKFERRTVSRNGERYYQFVRC